MCGLYLGQGKGYLGRELDKNNPKRLRRRRLIAAEKKALDELVFHMTAPHTLEEIAEFLGCPLITVWRIEQEALRKMRKDVHDDWESGTQDPPQLQSRMFHVGPTNGKTATKIKEK